MKQMFDTSEKLISEQSDEDSSWKHSSLARGEEVIRLSHKGLRIFSLCILPRKMSENPQSNTFWEDRLMWFRRCSEYRALDTIDGVPMEFEWNILTRFTILQLRHKSKSSCRKSAQNQKISQHGSTSCRCLTTFHGYPKTMNGNANRALSSFLCMQKDFTMENGHSSDLDQKRSGILTMNTNHKENGTESLNRWRCNSQKTDTPFSVPRVQCPEERSKAKVVENIRTLLRRPRDDWNFFRTEFVNQLSIHRAVWDVCEEYCAC